MTTDDTLFFIDANKYLDLYRTETGQYILSSLSTQADYIFVTRQVVDEVRRNKINETARFLVTHFKDVPKAQTYKVPDQLFGASRTQSESIQRQMKEIHEKIEEVNKELRALAADIMNKVSQSTDEVSTALAPIFAKAVCPSAEHEDKATARKLRGNPPGKATDPLGDQLTWEQILSQFIGKTKLWIVSKDSDYGIMHGGRGFLNHFLVRRNKKCKSPCNRFLLQ
jgi:hypothetical protein